MIRALLFDWGDTLMRDYPEKPGAACFWEEIEWIPEAESALKVLTGDYSCYVASNSGCSNTRLMIKALDRMGATKYFDGYYTSVDIGFEKPDINFFLTIAKWIDCKPEECVMIGNSLQKDIEGALNSGMKAIYLNQNKHNGKLPYGAKMIHNMDQLAETIHRIAS